MGSQTIDSSLDVSPDATGVMDDLRRIVQALRTQSRTVEREAGVSSAQLFVLRKLADGPAASLGELATRTCTHQSSVSVVVSKLVQRGLVVRRGGKEDARRVELTLSPSGRALVRRAPEVAQQRLLDALERMSKLERKRLAEGLSALVGALGLSDEAPPLFFEDETPVSARARAATTVRTRRARHGV